MNQNTETQWFDPFRGHPIAASIRQKFNGILHYTEGDFILREFPDGETYVQIQSAVSSRVVVFADLSRPDAKLLKLLLFTDALRDQGAEHITLIAPYLPYMRQDISFKVGEAVTSRTFARLLSGAFDRLITIDPHLHRYKTLDDVYTLDGIALSASDYIADWIKTQFMNPVLVGPDAESRQWVEKVAQRAGCAYRVCAKTRLGDWEVAIDTSELDGLQEATLIMVDDIISTGRTMIAAAAEMVAQGLPRPICIAVHSLFAGDAWEAMNNSDIAQVITCNTIAHPSNRINLADLIVSELLNLPDAR